VESGNDRVAEFQARDAVCIMAAFESASLAKVCSCLPNDYFKEKCFYSCSGLISTAFPDR